jgi:hypothetical protein
MTALWEQTSAVGARSGTRADAEPEVDVARFGLTPLWFAPYLTRAFVIGRAYGEGRGSVSGSPPR